MFGILLGITIRQKTNGVCIFQISILLQIKYIIVIENIFELIVILLIILHKNWNISYMVSESTIETSNIGGSLICQLSSAHLLGNWGNLNFRRVLKIIML